MIIKKVISYFFITDLVLITNCKKFKDEEEVTQMLNIKQEDVSTIHKNTLNIYT